MSHLNFNIRPVDVPGRQRAFNPRANTSVSGSIAWTILAVVIVSVTTFGIVWFA